MIKMSVVKFVNKILENDLQSALSEFTSYTSMKDCSKEMYIPGGILLRKLKEPLKALHLHESIINDIPNILTDTLYMEIAKDYVDLKDYEKAVYYLKLLSKIADIPLGYKLWYEILLKQDKFDEADKMCLKYQKVSGKDMSKRLSFISLDAYKKTDNPQYLKKCLKYYPLNRDGRLLNLQAVIQSGKVSKIQEEIEFIFHNDIPKAFDDVKNIEKWVFDMGIMPKVESIIFQKVATGSDNPVYHAAAADTLVKKGESVKASEVLHNYIMSYGKKNVITNKYFELSFPSEIVEKLKEDKIYRCTKCGAVFEKYHDICPVCNHIERFVFI